MFQMSINNLLEMAHEILYNNLGREPTNQEVKNYLQRLEAWHERNEASFDFSKELDDGNY